MDHVGLGPRASAEKGLGPRASGLLGAALIVVGGCGDHRRKQPAVEAARDASGARTARVLDEAGLTALAAVTVGGDRIVVARRAPDDFGAVVTAADGTAATVTISKCLTCAPLDATAWERERATWSTMLAPAPADRLTIERVVRGPWPLIELRARRTMEGVAEVVVQAHWNDGATQLWASCERVGADDAERACQALVEAAALAYLPALAP